VKAPAYLPVPGDRVEVAPKGWSAAKDKWHYEAFVHAYDAESDTVVLWRDRGWGFGEDSAYTTVPTLPAKLVRQVAPKVFPDPEPPRQFQFSIRYEAEVPADKPENVLPARWVVTAVYDGWVNTYYETDETAIWNHIDGLLQQPVCGTCGCQLAEVNGHVVCQRSLDHKQIQFKPTWHVASPYPVIKQSPIGGYQHNGARFKAWMDRNAEAMTVRKTTEPYLVPGKRDIKGNQLVVQRPVIEARWLESYTKDDYKRVDKWRHDRATFMPSGYYWELVG
jgi:hypothetical protein